MDSLSSVTLIDYSADIHAGEHNVDVVKSVIHPVLKQKHTAGLNTTNDGVVKEMGDSAVVKL